MWSSYDDPTTNLSKIHYYGIVTWHMVAGMMFMQWESGGVDDDEMRQLIKEIRLYDITQEWTKGPNYTFLDPKEVSWTVNNFSRIKAY